jgi:hypothetical protein
LKNLFRASRLFKIEEDLIFGRNIFASPLVDSVNYYLRSFGKFATFKSDQKISGLPN